MSIILIVLSLIFFALQRHMVNRRSHAGSLINKPEVKPLKGLKSVAAHGVCYGIVLLSSLPSAVVIYMSFRKTRGPVFHPGFSLDSYARVISEVPHVITNSFVFSVSAVVFIVILGSLVGYVVARRRSSVSGALGPS